jgi:hypothetical protein
MNAATWPNATLPLVSWTTSALRYVPAVSDRVNLSGANVTQPLTSTIAVALATGASAALSDGVRALLTQLAARVRERFRRNSSDQDILESAAHGPRDDGAVERLAEALDRHMREDPAFAGQLRSLWTEIAAAGRRDEITNLVAGEVHGSVVQARDVQGGITFHAPR